MQRHVDLNGSGQSASESKIGDDNIENITMRTTTTAMRAAIATISITISATTPTGTDDIDDDEDSCGVVFSQACFTQESHCEYTSTESKQQIQQRPRLDGRENRAGSEKRARTEGGEAHEH